MSRSVRAAQGQSSAVPRQNDTIWAADGGGIRTGWLLAVSLFGYMLVALATRFGLMRAFAALFEAWGVDGSNIHRAPAWAQAVYTWHGSLATVAFSVLLLVLARWLRGLWRLNGPVLSRPSGGLWRASLTGILMALIIAALGLLPDSMRLEWPLNAPVFTGTLPVMAVVSLLCATAEEAYTKRVLYDGLSARWSRLWATAVSCAVFWLTGNGYAGSIVSAVNVLLLGMVCCMLYTRFGFWTSVGFRWGWSLANVFLLGFGGGEGAVYRLYGVSEALLTGGDAGPMHGLWTTLLLMGGIVALFRRHK